MVKASSFRSSASGLEFGIPGFGLWLWVCSSKASDLKQTPEPLRPKAYIVEAKKLEHHYPHALKVRDPSTNPPKAMFQLSGLCYNPKPLIPRS